MSDVLLLLGLAALVAAMVLVSIVAGLITLGLALLLLSVATADGKGITKREGSAK